MLNFVGCKIMIIGDVMLDEYIDTSIGRISPEAPVPVARIEEKRSVPGGAANVACNLACLGCSPFVAGFRGRDSYGEQLQKILENQGIKTLFVLTDDRSTTIKTRIVSKGQQLLRLDNESDAPILAKNQLELWKKIYPFLKEMDAVILSDYKKGTLQRFNNDDSLATRVIAICKSLNIPVLVDPKGTDWSRYANADCITPNIREMTDVSHSQLDNLQAITSSAHKLMERFHLPRLLLTRGEKGVALIEKESTTEIDAQTREVADVSGAGDTVIAVLAACMAKKFSWNDAARMANLAAGIVVGKSGTSPVELQELRDAMLMTRMENNRQLARLNDKIHNLEQLKLQTSLWKNAGKTIVFTNGCFDLLHMGHIQLLEEASSLGDKLVVALNTDASIKRLKGSDRPVQSEKARAIVMAALEEVDAVIMFDEDTPLKLIEAITPDVLVKGGDYQIENIVGADHVLKNGGKVHLANFVNGYSTSCIINTMQKKKK